MFLLSKHMKRILYILVLFFAISTQAMAIQTRISFEKLGIQEDIQLRTVKNSYDIHFTRPQSVNFTTDPTVKTGFRLSPSLLPERYSLTVFLNGNIIKTVKGADAKSDKVNFFEVKLPVNKIKDYNTLTFTVNQHYTYKCEDPFDSSLWTVVKKDSYIDFSYNKKHAPTDLAKYPFPIFDEFSYLPTEIVISMPKYSNVSDQTINSMGILASDIAKFTAWRPLKLYTSENNDKYTSKNKIVVGTPYENADIIKYAKYLPYKIQDGYFVDSRGSLLKDEGILMEINNPEDPSAVIIFVTGNTPDAVFKAAKTLTQNPVNRLVKGNKGVIYNLAPTKLAKIRDWSDFVHNRTTVFKDLRITDVTSRGITAIPIEYNFKIMPDMHFFPGSKAKLVTYYNYASGLDYNLSNLEIVLNGVSLHSKKLDPPTGDNFMVKKLELEVPVENLQVYNNLQFRYHIYPEKYDLCRFVTDEFVWGTIYKNTTLKVPGEVKAKIPNLDYLNDGGYPFTAYPDMQNTVFVLNSNPDYSDLKALVDLSASFGKQMFFTNYMNFAVVKDKDFKHKLYKNYNIIALGKQNDFDFYNRIKNFTIMNYAGNSLEMKDPELAKQHTDILSYKNIGVIEQIISPFNSKRVIMLLSGENNAGLDNAASLFSDSLKFQNIKPANIAIVAENTVKYIDNYPEKLSRYLFTEEIAEQRIFGIPLQWVYNSIIFMACIWLIKKIFFRS